MHLGARPSCAGFFCSFGLPNNDGGCGDVGAAAPLGADDGHGEGGGGEDSELLLLPAVCTALCGCARDNQRRGVFDAGGFGWLPATDDYTAWAGNDDISDLCV